MLRTRSPIEFAHVYAIPPHVEAVGQPNEVCRPPERRPTGLKRALRPSEFPRTMGGRGADSIVPRLLRCRLSASLAATEWVASVS